VSSYLVNPAHTGAVAKATLTPPLVRLWTVYGSDTASYPVIAGGVVYAVVGQIASPYRALVAYDAATGTRKWTPINLGAANLLNYGAPAYDDGRIFVLADTGVVKAVDASRGTVLWSTPLFADMYSIQSLSMPTAYRGIVYVSTSTYMMGHLYAIDEATGAVLWSQMIDANAASSPAVSEQGVFVACACGRASAYDRISGAVLWSIDRLILGGQGPATPVVYQGKVYLRSGGRGQVLDATNGSPVGPLGSAPPPSFDGNLAFFMDLFGTLRAVSLTTGAVSWTFVSPPDASADPLVSNAVIAGGYVYVGSNYGVLYAVDEATGALAWSDPLSGQFYSWDDPYEQLGGMAASGGILVASVGKNLFAYGSATPDAGH
jgi:outer membrane protein assembly factor BamB